LGVWIKLTTEGWMEWRWMEGWDGMEWMNGMEWMDEWDGWTDGKNVYLKS